MEKQHISQALCYALKNPEYREKLVEYAMGWDPGLNNDVQRKSRFQYWLHTEPTAVARKNPNTPNTCLLYTSPSPRDS